MSLFLAYFIIASLVFAALDILVALKAIHKRNIRGYALGGTCFCCALVDLSYLLTAVVDNYTVYSIMSSIYFLSVDMMCIFLVVFVRNFCKMEHHVAGKHFLRTAMAFVVLDVIVFLINPVKEIAISYVPRATEFAKYSYDMHLWFYVHLTFCYLLVASAVIFLIYKAIRVPLEYKRQYLNAILGVLAIVLINAVFLFLPGLSVYNFLDYSIFGYSLGAYIFYWACFQYSTKGMQKVFKMSIVENIDQGLVLFDNADELILHNEVASRQWPEIKFREMMTLKEFTTASKLDIDFRMDSCVLQCYSENDGENKPLRCEFRVLKNKHKQVLGSLFTFSNASLTTDPLTGFHNWDNFTFFAEETDDRRSVSMMVLVCDIIGLSLLNNTDGRLAGDKKIKILADLFRKEFPKDSYFVRGPDANFIVLVPTEEPSFVVDCIERIKKQFDSPIQYAINKLSIGDAAVERIDEAMKGLRQKKLLNKESTHSMILNSLVQALQECDPDTEDHVKRTQLMAAELGKRIGLDDIQQSNLSLLCLLHDVGKIGVPIEILNKPGKLTAEEWQILRSHPMKGFQIASSSSELKGIADMILHHHERWDGGGYPDGLSRESIPLLSRVIAVVDAYDAMVHTRAYRPAFPQSVALDELKHCAGSQFDPGIVSEFIKLVESLPKESSAAPEPSAEAKSLVREELNQGSDTMKISTVHNLIFTRYVVDEQFNIIAVDDAFEHLTGYSREEAVGHMNHLSLIPEEDRTEYMSLVVEETNKQPQAFFEHRLVRKDGSVAYVFCIGRQFYDSVARAGRSEIVVTDVSNSYSLRVIADVERTKAKSREAKWENAFRKDPLTGVLNRAAFKSDTEFKLLEGKSKVMLLMVDVDHFKNYNDTYGHVAGDEFLASVGQTLQSCLRHNDIAGRMGGDEFAAALFFKKECSDEFMYQRAQQIFDKVNMVLAMNPHATSLSMGAVIADEDLQSFSDLYACADKRLYKSKEGGRSRLSVS